MTREFSKDLLEYYDKNRRILPWREDPKPYNIWVSEIMLQQTRVDTVIDYYLRFIEELPNVVELAACEEDRLLKLWQGLGYYSRVKNMKIAANQILEHHDGKIPEIRKDLEKLKGIGPYTAGAISSIAFQKAETCIDGNFLRVMSRVLAQEGDPRQKDNFKNIDRETFQRMDKNRPGDFNQAMMDIGATVCIPKGLPKCEICPLSFHCEAYKRGEVEKYPEKVVKASRKIEYYTVFLILQDQKILIEKRPNKGLLSSLWGYPMVKKGEEESYLQEFRKEYPNISTKAFKKSKHIFSHREWIMESLIIELPSNFAKESQGEYLSTRQWVDISKVEEDYSIPTAFKVYTDAFCKGEIREL